MATKIPFAYSLDHERMVEVSTVRSGKACNCICPSCQQAVQARKGSKNIWCFAHDPLPGETPDVECDISFLVSARQFIADSAIAGDLPDFTTAEAYLVDVVALEIPGIDSQYWPSKEVSVKLTDSTFFQNVSWEKGPGHYDLTLVLPNSNIHLYLAYPGKNSPEIPQSKTSDGYFLLNIKSLETSYQARKSIQDTILTMAHDLFLGSEHKEWVYHPRQDSQSFQEKVHTTKAEAKNQLKIEFESRHSRKHKDGRPLQAKNDPKELDSFENVDLEQLDSNELAASRRFPALFEFFIRHGHSPQEAARKSLKQNASNNHSN